MPELLLCLLAFFTGALGGDVYPAPHVAVRRSPLSLIIFTGMKSICWWIIALKSIDLTLPGSPLLFSRSSRPQSQSEFLGGGLINGKK